MYKSIYSGNQLLLIWQSKRLWRLLF